MGSGTRYSARRNVGIIVLTCCTFLAAGCSRTQEIPSGRVELPQGCFVMGELRIYPEEGPLSEVCLEGFEIMRTEVTNRQFQAFVDATGYVTRAERGWRSDEAGGPGVDVPPASAVFVSPIETAGTQQSWWKLTEGASWTSPAGKCIGLKEGPTVFIAPISTDLGPRLLIPRISSIRKESAWI